MPHPGRLSPEECRKRSAEGSRTYWEAERPAREARREAIRDAAAAEIGALTTREVILAGAIAHWCEGSKSKPYRRSQGVEFINGDPSVILFFLRFLSAATEDAQSGTLRKNVGDDYHGCLRINVSRSADLYRKIDGWARAAMAGAVAESRSGAESA